jgi:bacterioferritin-associated ferredoxin
MIVCSCNAFSDHQVRSAVANAARRARMSKIYRCIGFRVQCGRCTYTIKQIIDEISEPRGRPGPPLWPNTNWPCEFLLVAEGEGRILQLPMVGTIAELDQGQEPHRDEADLGMKLDRHRRNPTIKSLVVKQSVVINGHNTSMSIERAFWKALKEIAVAQNISANTLISNIDNEREAANLSSAIRVYVVEHYRLAANASADKPSNT